MFEGARSAEPPTSHGQAPAMALSTLPEATRVETGLPPQSGMSAAKSAGRRCSMKHAQRAAKSASAAQAARSSRAHLARRRRILAVRASKRTRTSSGTTKEASGSKPRACLVRRSSSGPNGAPWLAAVPALLGEPLPMTVRQMMNVGRSSERAALRRTRSMSAKSWPSHVSTRQP